jgi:hypothetical protein
MTPLEIEILMHYRCRAVDYRDGDHSAPAVKEAIEGFIAQGLLTHHGFCIERFDDGSLRARYAVTDRAIAYLDALCNVPLPVSAWIVPAQERLVFETSARDK